MAQQRLVVGFTSNREQAEAAAEELRNLGLTARVTQRTGETEAPFAVAYYARNGREAARLEQVFESLQIEGEVMYDSLPDDHRLVRVYNTLERPGAAEILANLLERAGLHVVRGYNELLVPRSQEPVALDVIRQFEQASPKRRGSLFDWASDEDAAEHSEPPQGSEIAATTSNSAYTDWETVAVVAGQSRHTDEAATVGPPVGELPDAWPCCPSCHRPRETNCPMCGETGSHFPAAELVPEEFVNRRPVPPELAEVPWPVLCPVCDWLFEPEFYRRCPWCGHDFGRGREVVLKSPMAREPMNVRVVLGIILTIAVVIAVLAYLAIVSRVRDPKVRPARVAASGIGITATAPYQPCMLA